MKETNLKRLHIVRYQLYNILERGKRKLQKHEKIVPVRGWGGGRDKQGKQSGILEF